MSEPLSDLISAISTTEEIIDEARAGRMFILADHEDRENEGDLVIPARMCTPETINFMATHGRGLICLALAGARVDALGLSLMSARNTSPQGTAFTVSIEARDGITTGISAAERAHTVAVAIDAATGPGDIVTPGHVFPLRARDGGVLTRAGHTEAAVDIARLAGMEPAGVICEIMRDDGEMARLPDLVAFAQLHNVKLGLISDLIRHRLLHDPIECRESRPVTSIHGGEWAMHVFVTAGGGEHVALVNGDVTGDAPVPVFLHALNPVEDALGIGGGDALATAMRLIAAEGRGVIVLLREVAPVIGASTGGGTDTSPTPAQWLIGGRILATLGLTRVTLLTKSPMPADRAFDGTGLVITGTRSLME